MHAYLKEWNEACAYARECLPPPNVDPYTPFVWIGVAGFVIWAVNEWRLTRRQ